MQLFKTVFYCSLILFISASCGSSKEKSDQSGSETKDTPKVDQAQIQYNQYCRSCHQTNGEGVPGMYPPLAGSDWVQGDKSRIIHSIIFGLEGKIEVNGETYDNAMPGMDYMTDEEIASVLTYIRKNFGNNASEISAQEVAKVRTEGN